MIDEVFGATGLLSKKFPGYAPRKGQIDMARAVEAAIAGRRHLVVEGPTGTGKSLAYLVPAIDHSIRATAAKAKQGSRAEVERVIVVTANIALQEQLVSKDLPLLADVLETPFRFQLAKGKNNYLCLDSLAKTIAEGLMKGDRFIQRILDWAQTTETGDVSEFPDVIAPATWRKFSTSSDECKGKRCKYYEQCWPEIAKRGMHNAHVVVTNYHLFFAHLLVREKMRQLAAAGAPVDPDVVLPAASVVIFDEAHKAADIARDFLGFSLTKGQIDWLVRGFNHEIAGQTVEAANAFFAAVLSHKKSHQYRSRLKPGHPLTMVGEALAMMLDRVSKFYKDSVTAAAWDEDQKAELEHRAKRGAVLASQVRQAIYPEKQKDVVFFIEDSFNEATGRSNVSVKSKPIDVAPWLKTELFEQFKTVVLTSATLATSDTGGFSFVKKEMGLEKSDELVAESPFAWKDQVLLVVPKTMCMPDDRDMFPSAVAQHVKETCEAANGRTLGLFTSYKNLKEAAARLERFRHRVFKQGDAPRTKITQQFRDDVNSVLLGVESFWAGVDVPGESLSVVVIDRLPFPTPDDPIVDAISERDDKWFFNYAIPRAIIQFKQGFGRLIRTTTDRGCVVVLDRRIREKPYGRQFLKALPPVLMSDDVTAVGRFLAASEKVA